MKKKKYIILLGVLVALSPFLMVWSSWKDILSFVFGALIVWIASGLPSEEKKSEPSAPMNAAAPNDYAAK